MAAIGSDHNAEASGDTGRDAVLSSSSIPDACWCRIRSVAMSLHWDWPHPLSDWRVPFIAGLGLGARDGSAAQEGDGASSSGNDRDRVARDSLWALARGLHLGVTEDGPKNDSHLDEGEGGA